MPLPLWVVADLIAIVAIAVWEPIGRVDDAVFQSAPWSALKILLLTYAIRILAMTGVMLLSAAIYLTSMYS